MPIKTTMNPLHLFVPITRMEERPDGLLLEGFCYENAVVGDGWNLKRSALEAATPDYTEYSNIREMHQPSAVGTADAEGCGVEWNDNGCFMRALIVDTDAIKKCTTGVYKGFSVGVRPTVVRGKDVETCLWYETSLVDRPADPGARFSIVRAEGIAEEGPGEIEVEAYATDEPLPIERAARDEAERIAREAAEADTIRRGIFADKMKQRENPTRRGLAFSTLSDSMYRILNDSTIADTDAAVREAIQEFADYVAPLIVEARQQAQARADALAEAVASLPDDLYYGEGIESSPEGDANTTPPDIITRFAEATRIGVESLAEITRVAGERDTALTRITGLETELSTAREDITRRVAEITAKDATIAARDAEIKRLGNMTDPRQETPVRFHGSEREFMANRAADNTKETQVVEEARTEIARLTTELENEKDEKKRVAGIAQLNRLRGIIANG